MNLTALFVARVLPCGKGARARELTRFNLNVVVPDVAATGVDVVATANM